MGLVLGPSRTSVELVMSADLIIMGGQLGCRFRKRAASPATCWLDIDVPLYKLKSCPPFPGGATAAMMSCPGAITSGLSRLPFPARRGPREENDAVNGAGTLNTICAWLMLAVAPTPAAKAFTAARSVFAKCTVCMECKEAMIELMLLLTIFIPTP